MYLGTSIIPVKHYGQAYRPGFGAYTVPTAVVDEIRHNYICDACGHTAAFREAAEERFFCRECQKLVTVEAGE